MAETTRKPTPPELAALFGGRAQQRPPDGTLQPVSLKAQSHAASSDVCGPWHPLKVQSCCVPSGPSRWQARARVYQDGPAARRACRRAFRRAFRRLRCCCPALAAALARDSRCVPIVGNGSDPNGSSFCEVFLFWETMRNHLKSFQCPWIRVQLPATILRDTSTCRYGDAAGAAAALPLLCRCCCV